MNNIEIATAHNIIFRYELASPIQRILATIIDLFIVAIFSTVVSMIFSGIPALHYLILTIGVGFYHLFFEMFNFGQSPGKMLVKLRVITLKGGTPSPSDLLLRWIFRMVDIVFSFGTLGLMFISSTNRSQRIGDILAQTIVISLQNDLSVSLKSLENFSKDQGEIMYPEMARYNDKDMLLLKQSINRYLRYPNKKNEEVLFDLAAKIGEDLELDKKTTNNINFLQRALTEYIILTR